MKDLSALSCFTSGWVHFLVVSYLLSVFDRKVKPVKLFTLQHSNPRIDNSLTFAQLSVSLWLASASSLFSRLWLRSLLKALYSHTPLRLKQANTHTLTAAVLLTPGWFGIHDKEAFSWISKCCIFEHVAMTHVLGLPGSQQAGCESDHPDATTGEQSDQSAVSRTWEYLLPFQVAIDFWLLGFCLL